MLPENIVSLLSGKAGLGKGLGFSEGLLPECIASSFLGRADLDIT